MRTEVLPISTLDPKDVERWRELAARAVEPNPFFEPDFAIPAARALPADAPALLVARAASGTWTAALPVRRTRRWRGVPIPGLAAWRHPYCFLGTPLVERDHVEESVAALVDAPTRASAAYTAWEWLGGDGPVVAALEAALTEREISPVRFEEFDRATLRRRPGNDYAAQGKGAHHRRELARLGRRLQEQLGGPLELADRAADAGGVERFLSVERSGWKGTAGSALASSPAHASFFHEICRLFAARGDLQLLELSVERRPVALKCNLRAGGVLFCFKIAHEEGLRAYSPGIQLESRMIDLFHDEPELAWMDSCADPGNTMINRLWPDHRRITTLVVPAPGVLGRATRHAMRARMNARRTPRSSHEPVA